MAIYRRAHVRVPHCCQDDEQEQQQPADPCDQCGVVHTEEEPFCYIQPRAAVSEKAEKKRMRTRYVFFDIETSQNRKLKLDSGIQVFRHEAILLVAAVICTPCMDAGISPLPGRGDDENSRGKACCCAVFGPLFRFRRNLIDAQNRRRLAFDAFNHRRENVVDRFIDFLCTSTARYTTTIVISHNGGRFDNHFVLERLIHRGVVPTVVSNGLKFYSVGFVVDKRRIILKDSLNFFSSPLAALWSTFDLGEEGIEEKPFFPYLYIKRRNLERRLPHLPARRYYAPDEMKPKARAAFNTWYNTNQQRQPFHLKAALLEYCCNDVDILAAACIKFRRLLRSISPRVEPFVDASTIAKLTMEVFRAGFLPPNTMCNLPEGGINNRGRQSLAALRFFRTLEAMTGLRIRTAEYSLGEAATPVNAQGSVYRLDGLIEGPPRIALEFYGCWSHGKKTTKAFDKIKSY
jgi:hypothetical protein